MPPNAVPTSYYAKPSHLRQNMGARAEYEDGTMAPSKLTGDDEPYVIKRRPKNSKSKIWNTLFSKREEALIYEEPFGARF